MEKQEGVNIVQATPLARTVVRCECCSLVQYMTASIHCRRCRRQLPGIIPIRVEGRADGRALEISGPLRPGRTKSSFVIGRTISALRNANGMRQDDLANTAGIERTYVSRMENNRISPSPRMLMRLSAAFGVPATWLLMDAIDAQILFAFSRLTTKQRAVVMVGLRQKLAA